MTLRTLTLGLGTLFLVAAGIGLYLLTTYEEAPVDKRSHERFSIRLAQIPIACISGFAVVAYLPRLAFTSLAERPIASLSGFAVVAYLPSIFFSSFS